MTNPRLETPFSVPARLAVRRSRNPELETAAVSGLTAAVRKLTSGSSGVSITADDSSLRFATLSDDYPGMINATFGKKTERVDVYILTPPRPRIPTHLNWYSLPPRLVAARIAHAALSHVLRLDDHGMTDEEVADERRHLDRIAAAVAATRPYRIDPHQPLLVAMADATRSNGQAEAATPWKGLTAPTRDVWGTACRELLTRAERVRWGRSPIIEIDVGLSDDCDKEHPVIGLGPLTGAQPPENPVELMRLMNGLDLGKRRR